MKNLVLFAILFFLLQSQTKPSYQLAVLKYNGGGDYYANPTALPNLIKFCNKELKTNISIDVPYVEAGSADLFEFPMVHMTGHGNVVFSRSELENIRTYLRGGGFLHIDDNYGMDQFIRPEIKKLFPDIDLVEIPSNHKIFNQTYKLNGLPKIHEHDGKPAQAFGIIIEGKIVLLYTYETDLSDGWENQEVHGDQELKRTEALKMGANILSYAFMN